MCESMLGIHPIISEIDKKNVIFWKASILDTDSLRKTFSFEGYTTL